MRVFDFKAKSHNERLIEALQDEIERAIEQRREVSRQLSRMNRKLDALLAPED